MGAHITRCVTPAHRVDSLLREMPTGTTPLVAIFGISDRLLTSVSRSCRFGLRVALCVLAINSAQSGVVAQESTRSHRLLGNGLPTLSGGQSQMELLRRLQLLSGAALADGKTPADSPLANPEAMKRLQQAMQSLQKLNSGSPNNSPPFPQGSQLNPDRTSAGDRNAEPSQAPSLDRGANPDATSSGLSSNRSTLQRIAERMGLSLDGPNEPSPDSGSPRSRSPETGAPATQPRQNDGSGNDRPGTRPLNPLGNAVKQPDETPQGTVSGSRRGPGSDASNPSTELRSGDPATGNSTGERPTTRPSLPPGTSLRSDSRTRPGPDSRTTGSRTTGSDSEMALEGKAPASAEPPRSSMQSLLDWLKKQDQSASGGGLPSELSGSTPRNSRDSGSGMPGNEQTRPTGSDAGRAPRSPGRGRDDVSNAEILKTDEPKSPWSRLIPGGKIAPPRSSNGNSSANQNRTNQETSQTGNNGRPSPGSQLPRADNTTPGTSPADFSAGGNNEMKSPAQLAQDRLNAQREERLDEVRSSKKSLRQKLLEIAKLARLESNQADPSDEAATEDAGGRLQSAFVDALAKATKGLAEQAHEIVNENRSSRRVRDGRSGRRERDGPFEQLAGIGNQANKWLADSVEPDAPSTSVMSDNFGGAVSTGFPISTELLIVLVFVGGFAFWLLQKKRGGAKLQSSRSARSSTPASLQNRQDIVQAFHDLADRCPAVMADWWTHDRAAQALATSRPDVDDEVRQLAQLYEQARYQPEESALTDEQLATAKAAWLRCRNS